MRRPALRFLVCDSFRGDRGLRAIASWHAALRALQITWALPADYLAAAVEVADDLDAPRPVGAGLQHLPFRNERGLHWCRPLARLMPLTG